MFAARTNRRQQRRILPSTPAEMMAELHRTNQDWCLMCNGRPHNLIIWVPTANVLRQLGVADGACRTVSYCLCRKCDRRRPGVLVEAENKILAEARALLARPSELTESPRPAR